MGCFLASDQEVKSKKFKVPGSRFKVEISAKTSPQPKDSLNKSISCRAGALASTYNRGRLF
jgi:hypothetical protein